MANSWASFSPGLKFLVDKLSKGGPTIEVLPPWQMELGKNLGGWANQFLPKYNPGEAYGGQMTAGMTPFETSGLDQLGSFLTNPGTGELFGQAQGQISDTLGGKYLDPNTNPWIKSMINLSNMNLNDSIDASRRGAGARGSYFSRSAIQDEGKIRSSAQTNLDAIIGNALNTERGRQFSAAPLAQSFDQYENQTVPLTKIGASQSYGSLQRTIDQADLERQYSDFQRQRNEQGAVPGIAQGIYNGGQAPAPATLQQPNQFSQTLQSLMGIMAKLGPMLMAAG